MPYPKYHVAVLTSPDKYSLFRRKGTKKGISLLFGKLKTTGKLELHSIWFEASRYTPSEAKAWLKSHGYSNYKFEPATKLTLTELLNIKE